MRPLQLMTKGDMQDSLSRERERESFGSGAQASSGRHCMGLSRKRERQKRAS